MIDDLVCYTRNEKRTASLFVNQTHSVFSNIQEYYLKTKLFVVSFILQNKSPALMTVGLNINICCSLKFVTFVEICYSLKLHCVEDLSTGGEALVLVLGEQEKN